MRPSLIWLVLTLESCLAVTYTVNQDWRDSNDLSEESSGAPVGKTYTPDWESLDSRPLPAWYDAVKFGIFIHWGVFSVPSFGSEWFWRHWKSDSPDTVKYRDYMSRRYPPSFTYQSFAGEFTAEFWDPERWSRLFAASGAKYVVLTSKHHEGYALWPSKRSYSWNSMDVGPNRDLVGELATAIRSVTDLRFGLYHSLFEWFNPLWLADQASNFVHDDFVMTKTLPELRELVANYKPDVIWSDGEWDAPDTYWRSKEFLAWLYNESPVRDSVVVNDRWGHETACHHGDFYTCADRYNPGVLQKHKWENAMTIDRKSWGYRREAVLADYLTIEEIVKELVITVSCGGNMLLNVGPTKDGTIDVIFEERLRQMGEWLAANGEAIYDTSPYTIQNDTVNGNVWWTMNKSTGRVYGSLLVWPENNVLRVAPMTLSVSRGDRVCLLGPDCRWPLNWHAKPDELVIDLPIEARAGKPAWVIRVERFAP